MANFLLFILFISLGLFTIASSHSLRKTNSISSFNKKVILTDPTPSKQAISIQFVLNSALSALNVGDYESASIPFSSTVWIMPPGVESTILSTKDSKAKFLQSIFPSPDFSIQINISKVSIYEPTSSHRGDYIIITHCTYTHGENETGKMIIMWDQVGSGAHASKLRSTYAWSITWLIWNSDGSLELTKQNLPLPVLKQPASFEAKDSSLKHAVDSAKAFTSIQNAWVKCLEFLAIGDYISASHLFAPVTEIMPPSSPSFFISNSDDKITYFEKYVASGYTLGVTLEEIVLVQVKYASGVGSNSAPHALTRSSYLLLDQSAALIETGKLVQLWGQNWGEWSIKWSIWNSDWEAGQESST